MSNEYAAIVLKKYNDYLQLKRFELHFSQKEIIEAISIAVAALKNTTDDFK